MRNVTITVPEEVLVKVWHYFNAGDEIQKKFMEDYNLLYLIDFINNNFEHWQSINNECCKLDIEPRTYYNKPIKDSNDKEKDVKEFTKDDLKTGMTVKLRNGEEYLVIRDCVTDWDNDNTKDFIVNKGRSASWNILEHYNDNMKSIKGIFNPGRDIMEVYSCAHAYSFTMLDNEDYRGKLLWSRKEEKRELTMDEIGKAFGLKDGTWAIAKGD